MPLIQPDSSRARLLATLLLSLILAGLGACASNPTGGANFVLMSENSEIEKGRELHEEMLKQLPIYKDAAMQAYVDKIGQKMAAISHRPELEYTFTIVDSPDINAFALPGGFVYINRGLLTYLTSEAQLAAVLGHEIGHITARHAVRQQTASRSSNVLSTALIIATGIPQLGDTASLFGNALLSGYGRDMELEADSLGAEYLAEAGYDPMAMVEVITVLKNQEDFKKKVSGKGVSYHGLFATHPRNDTRLREMVGKAGDMAGERTAADDAEFRRRMTGLPIGQTLQSAERQDRNRYYQNLLGYTLVFPDNWSMQETATTVTARSPEGDLSMRVEARRLKERKEPWRYMREDLGIEGLRGSEDLSQYGLSGHTGIDPRTGERVAVIYYGPRAFLLTGRSSPGAGDDIAQGEGEEDAGEGSSSDALLLASIRTFRPIARNERMLANPVQVDYIQADGRVRYADLASQSRLGQHAEDMLRLMNADYPAGEPEAGQWIKIAR